MKATLHVVGGSPLARPAISLEITSTKLSKVRSSQKLKTSVADTGSDGIVDLTAKFGHKTLGTKSNVHVGQGTTKDVTVRITDKGKKALKGLHHAEIKLKGSVEFGSDDSVKKTLRH
jgi:hypothetical protein